MRKSAFILILVLLGAGSWFSYEIIRSSMPVADPLSFLPKQSSEVIVVPSVSALSDRLNSLNESTAIYPTRSLFSIVRSWSNEVAALGGDERSTALYAAADSSRWLIAFEQHHSSFAQVMSAIDSSVTWSQNQKLWTTGNGSLNALEGDGWIRISNSPDWLIQNASESIRSDSSFVRTFNRRGKTAMMNWMLLEQDWFSLDLAIKQEKLLVNGYLSEELVSLPLASERSEIPGLPPDDSQVSHQSIAKDVQLWEQGASLWEADGKLAERNSRVTELETSLETSLREAFFDWPGRSITVIGSGDEALVIMGSQDIDLCTSRLTSLCDTMNAGNILGRRVFAFRFPIDLSLVAGPAIDVTASSCCILNDRVLLAGSLDQIRIYLEASELSRLVSIETSMDGLEFISRQSSQLQLLRAEQVSADKIWDLLFPAGQPDEQANLVVNLSRSNGSPAYLNMLYSGNAEIDNLGIPEGERWNLALNETFTRKPDLLTNHYSGEKEILIQDNAGVLHLISAQGKELWKRNVGAAIIGAVSQVDLYKNGKLQMVFVTEDKLYCLDRNGRDVEGFPVKLNADASAGLAVFDYDRNRDYRLLVPCTDGRIYNYGKDGKKVRGWDHRSSGSSVKAMEHFRIGSKDYILAMSEDGSIRLLKRNGDDRVKVSAKLKDWDGIHYQFSTESELNASAIFYADRAGAIHVMRIDGRERMLVQTAGPITAVQFGDLDEDDIPEVILSRENELRVYDIEGNLRWKKVFDATCGQAALYTFGHRDKRIGIQAGNEVWLLDSKGEAIEGFPVVGNTPLSIGDLERNGKFHMIYGNAGRFVIDRAL